MADAKRDKKFILMLSEREHALLTRMAAQATLRTKRRISAAEVMRLKTFGKSDVAFKPAIEASEMQAEAA